MSLALALALLLAAPPLPLAERVEGARSVERARDAFVLGATRPFDEVYPRSVFEQKVRREADEEAVLSREFGMEVTPELLAAEYERIEKETRAPDQWEAIKKALGGDRRMVEEVVCRPLLVDRALRARFAFDQTIHEEEHQQARERGRRSSPERRRAERSACACRGGARRRRGRMRCWHVRGPRRPLRSSQFPRARPRRMRRCRSPPKWPRSSRRS